MSSQLAGERPSLAGERACEQIFEQRHQWTPIASVAPLSRLVASVEFGQTIVEQTVAPLAGGVWPPPPENFVEVQTVVVVDAVALSSKRRQLLLLRAF